MAQLKDLLVAGPSRLIGDTYTTNLQVKTLLAPSTSNGTAYGAGESGQVLMSNGTSSYWGSASSIDGMGNYKTIQTAVTSPSAPTSGTTTTTAFIDTISQNTNGVITATKKNLPVASTSAQGIMKVGTGLSVSSGTVSVSYGNAANTALQGNANLVNLNGSNKTAASIASFYAPTAAGTSGQYLKSSGSGAPTWETFSASTVGLGNVTNHAQMTDIGLVLGQTNAASNGITKTISSGTPTVAITQAQLQSAIFVVSSSAPSDTSVIWLKPVS